MGADEQQQRRDYLSIRAAAPQGAWCDVLLSHQRVQAIGRRSMGAAKEAAYVVPAVLQNPVAIFEGLRRDEDEDRWGVGWRCYVGLPDKAYRPDGSEAAPWPGKVFLVFINEERVAYNWRWEKCDRADETLPEGYAERFTRKLL